MTVNVAENMNKFQKDSLEAIKETQDASLRAMQSFGEFAKEWSAKPGSVPSFENIPSPTQLVELTFGFAGALLEMRKNYTLKIAEMMVDAQKHVEARVEANTNPNTNPNMNPNAVKPAAK
jgi:hypothetical protein